MHKKRIQILSFLTVAIAGVLVCAGSAFADNEETKDHLQKIAIEQIYQDQKIQLAEDQRQNAEDQVREDNAVPPTNN
jgi:hypothetical protein